MAANLIIIPFAYKAAANTGVNIRNKKSSLDIYLKNCCVALISARINNASDTDCALVTNINVPEHYRKLLTMNGIHIIRQEFDCFNFGDSYRWSLAFYKLCALYRVVRCTQYDNYSYCDSDVYIQSSFTNVWKECRDHIMLYDINEGLDCEDFKHFMDEVYAFGYNGLITHYGGEFFAANRRNVLDFTEKAHELYMQIKDQGFETTHGDEFITSLVAAGMKVSVRNACPYVSRFWTGTFRMISPCYRTVTVLHFPAEKEYGLLSLYKKYMVKGKIPSNREVYRICHLHFPSLLTAVKILVKALLKIHRK